MNIHTIYRIYHGCTGVSTDSRNITPGVLFFSLSGKQHDGNRFAADALKNGAAYAVIDNPSDNLDKRFILVKSSLQTLQDLARYHRKQLHIPVIAITGSNGKTTTKELIKKVLEQKYRVHATVGNYNNHIGVPLTLLSIQKQTEMAIIEMGANHLGEIGDLCRIADPTYGIITNIGKAHMGEFGSFENIKKAKSELYRYLARHHGKVFIHADDELLHALLPAEVEKITYGSKEAADCQGNITETASRLSFRFRNNYLSKKEYLEVNTKISGSYNFQNYLAAACTGMYFKVGDEQIKEALEAYEARNNRSQILKTASNILHLDAYNANPTSMQQALQHFSSLAGPDKMVILGDMMELGPYAEEEHRRILEEVSSQGIPEAVFVGPLFMAWKAGFPSFRFYSDTEALAGDLKDHPVTGKTLLIKGSRTLELERLVSLL